MSRLHRIVAFSLFVLCVASLPQASGREPAADRKTSPQGTSGARAAAPAAQRKTAPAPAPALPPAAHVAPSTILGQAQIATGKNGMVASQEKRATRIGLDILQRGGNAVDAAVATGFALAVTLPKAGNLGGGGFMMIHLADGENVAVDYRETAPAATTRDVFLDENGEADPKKSRDTGLAVGVPGTVAGLSLAHARFGSGKFTLADLIAPALALARDGVPVEDDLVDSLLLARARLARWPDSAAIFLKPDGTPHGAGDLLTQPDLADTLEAIAADGPRAFYMGPIADRIVSSVREAGGLMTRGDLETYSARMRDPMTGTYRGYDIVSMPPPSSGGIHLIEMLNILENFPLHDLGAGSPATLHLLAEAMRLAYADRAAHLGDTDAVDVPGERLVSKDYAKALAVAIDQRHARASSSLGPAAQPGDGGNTTHFSVIDRDGNAVANTTSLNFNYGLGLVAKGTGVLLNNELDDFSAKPGAPNAFGLLGGEANAPGPGKRPLSSMTPTFVLKDGKVALVTGAPGGSRIISAVLQIVLNTIEFGKPLAGAVSAPRIHHQWMPDEISVERSLPPDVAKSLAAYGHAVRVGSPSGSAHSIAVTPEGFVGAADGRAKGALAEGF